MGSQPTANIDFMLRFLRHSIPWFFFYIVTNRNLKIGTFWVTNISALTIDTFTVDKNVYIFINDETSSFLITVTSFKRSTILSYSHCLLGSIIFINLASNRNRRKNMYMIDAKDHTFSRAPTHSLLHTPYVIAVPNQNSDVRSGFLGKEKNEN